MKVGLREILFVILLLAIPVGAWWFVFRPANIQHSKMREQIAAKQEKLRKLNRVVGTVGELQKEIDSLKKAVAFFRSKLPQEKEIDKVLQEIWRLAEKNKLITKSIRTISGCKRTDDFYASSSHAEQPINILIEGDFKGFYSFLQDLECQSRIMRISKMKLAKPKTNRTKKVKNGYIQADFEMSLFFERSEEG